MLKKLYTKCFKYFDKKDLKVRLSEHNNLPSCLMAKINIVYGEDKINNCFDIYYPKTKSNAKLPTIINIHGGGYVAGVKENCSKFCQELAKNGYFVINMEYTKSETKGFPTPIYETFKLFDYIKSNEEINNHIDYSKVFLCGDSAGGHIVSLVANILGNKDLKQRFNVESDMKVKGLILNSPVFGVFKFGNLRFLKNKMEEVVYNEYNGNSIKNACNNLELLNSNFPPCIIFSAINDVLNIHTNIFLKKAEQIGLCVENYNFIRGKNLGHDFIIHSTDEKEGKFALEKIFEFIDKACNNNLEYIPKKFNVNMHNKNNEKQCQVVKQKTKPLQNNLNQKLEN